VSSSEFIIINQHNITIYFVGFFANTAVEITAALRQSLALNGACPPLYKKPFYIVMRVAFAIFVAGPLPVLMGPSTVVSALYIGASAPVVVDRLASGALNKHQGKRLPTY
jgi:hypothetical protein